MCCKNLPFHQLPLYNTSDNSSPLGWRQERRTPNGCPGCSVISFFFFFLIFLTFIYLWDRERQSMNGGGSERERHRIGNRLQALSHQPRAWPGARTPRPRDRDLAKVGRLTDCATQAPPHLFFNVNILDCCSFASIFASTQYSWVMICSIFIILYFYVLPNFSGDLFYDPGVVCVCFCISKCSFIPVSFGYCHLP